MSEQELKIVITTEAAGVVPAVDQVTDSFKKLKTTGLESIKSIAGSLIGLPIGFTLAAAASAALAAAIKRLFTSSKDTTTNLKSLKFVLSELSGTTQIHNISRLSSELLNTTKALGELAAKAGADPIANITKLSAALLDSTLPLNQRKAALEEYNKVADKTNHLQVADLDNIKKVNKEIGDQINLLKTRALIKGAEDQIASLFKTVLANEFKISNAADKVNRSFDLRQLLSQGDDVNGFTRKIDNLQKASKVLGTAQVFVSQSKLDAAQQKIGELFNFIQRKIKEGVDFGSVLDLTKDPKTKAKNSTEFLFHFFPFDPSGKLKPEQRGRAEEAMRNFSKEFGTLLAGVDFNTGRDSDGAIKAANKWWKDFQKGIFKFKSPKFDLVTDVKVIPKDIDLDSGRFADRFKDAVTGLQDRLNGVGTNLFGTISLDPSLLKLEVDDKIKAKMLEKGKTIGDTLGEGVGNAFKNILDKKLQTALDGGATTEAVNKLGKSINANFKVAAAGINLAGEAVDDIFDKIKEGTSPMVAFFESISNSLTNLIKKLAQAAIQAALLSLITGGASKGGFSFLKAFGAITGFGGGNVNVARGSGFGELAFANGGGFINVQLAGRMRGPDIALSGSRTARLQGRGV